VQQQQLNCTSAGALRIIFVHPAERKKANCALTADPALDIMVEKNARKIAISWNVAAQKANANFPRSLSLMFVS
jgi:hypothetical protein